MNDSVYHLFILNPRSFWNVWKQNQVIEKIHGFFDSIENKNYKIHVSRFPRDAAGFIPEFARGLSEDGCLRVYAVGGDGILFDCLNGMMGLKNAELGAVPYGHTNNFLRGFGKNEKHFFRNISRQFNAQAIPIDVMRCGNNYALNFCVTGLEAEAARYAGKIRSKWNKNNTLYRWLSRKLYTFLYFIGAIAASVDKRLLYQQYEIDVDGETISGFFWGLPIFNGPYYGGSLHPVNAARPDDGILNMMLICGKGFLKIFSHVPSYVMGNYKKFPREMQLKQVKKIRIRSADILVVNMDDTVFYETELDVELLPGALRFVDASRCGYRGVCND